MGFFLKIVRKEVKAYFERELIREEPWIMKIGNCALMQFRHKISIGKLVLI